MNRNLFAALVALALAGCQSAPRSATDTQATTKSGTEAATAAAPKEIQVLTNQTQVWECPKCGMDYDGPGACVMDGTKLVDTQVSYICPADNQPVERAGKCPRCAVNARVVKVAMTSSSGGQ